MKYIKYLFIFIISIFMVNMNVLAASSKFDPLIDVQTTDIIDNQIFIIIGYEGENVLALTQEVAFESKYLELDKISPLAGFDITKGVTKDEGSYSTVKILADSNKVYNDVKYAILTFNVKDAFKVGKTARVFLYNYDSIGPNKDKYRHKGYTVTVKRDSKGEVVFFTNAIDDSTKRDIWLEEHFIIFVIIFLVIVLGILFIFLIPSKRKTENRSKDVKKTIEKNDKKKTIAPIKLDQELISSLGEEKKEIDMSEAIEVTDMKPFGDAVSKFDQTYDDTKLVDASADVFSMEADGIKDLESDTTEDGIEILSNDDDDDDKIDTLGLFIILFITSTLFIGNIRAIGYNIDDLKENIVNNLKYDKELDYNNDGKIDLEDLLETKDLDNLEYQEGIN